MTVKLESLQNLNSWSSDQVNRKDIRHWKTDETIRQEQYFVLTPATAWKKVADNFRGTVTLSHADKSTWYYMRGGLGLCWHCWVCSALADSTRNVPLSLTTIDMNKVTQFLKNNYLQSFISQGPGRLCSNPLQFESSLSWYIPEKQEQGDNWILVTTWTSPFLVPRHLQSRK